MCFNYRVEQNKDGSVVMKALAQEIKTWDRYMRKKEDFHKKYAVKKRNIEAIEY